jgi:enoyl-CoA hydratase/carnithine racemase
MLAMGAKFDANRARETGLVNAVTEPATLEADTLETARAIAARPREAVRLTRRLIRGDPSAILARIDEEAKLFSERLMSKEARQAFEAFLAKGKS